ncbi:ABC transporter ATP-binding protein [Nocardioides sp.]|uniref:ABC transporter ATP-binding protein n=1 Tax=Nocardioides sp. TaxID=35761 RepID=UPI003527E528
MGSSREAVVAFRSVSKVYGTGEGAVRALDEVTVVVPRGGFTAVMGPSGSGKSTFMNVAAGLDDVTSGEVLVAGEPMHLRDDRARTILRREQVGFVFQSFNLVPTLDVRENVLLPFELAGRRLTGEERGWVDHLLEVLGLSGRMSHRPGELSGGQQQRVAIARALAPRPAVVLADEPTGNLDTRSSREVLGLLRTAAREYGQTIVMVSHDPVAASYADRLLVLADGRLVGDHAGMSPPQIAELLIGLEEGAA